MEYHINVCAECETQSTAFPGADGEWVEACPNCLDSELIRYPVSISVEDYDDSTFVGAEDRG